MAPPRLSPVEAVTLHVLRCAYRRVTARVLVALAATLFVYWVCPAPVAVPFRRTVAAATCAWSVVVTPRAPPCTVRTVYSGRWSGSPGRPPPTAAGTADTAPSRSAVAFWSGCCAPSCPNVGRTGSSIPRPRLQDRRRGRDGHGGMVDQKGGGLWGAHATRRRLELDMYSEKQRLAFEYDGAQHDVYTPHFHLNEHHFAYRRLLDRLKDELCRSHGVTLIRIPWTSVSASDTVHTARFLEGLLYSHGIAYRSVVSDGRRAPPPAARRSPLPQSPATTV